MSLILIISVLLSALIVVRWLAEASLRKARKVSSGKEYKDLVLYCAKTAHARFFPVTHAFEYPVIYIGCDLAKLETQKLDLGSFWFRYNAWGILSISPSTYLGDVKGLKTMREKLLWHVQRHGISTSEIQSIYFVTMPRLLGYAFNPVSFYYLYDNAQELKIVILEVNNTFGEKHVYVLNCDDPTTQDAKPSAGYKHSFHITREFHVSPFNDRTGSYTAHVLDPRSSAGLEHFSLKLVYYSAEEKPRKKMMARLDGDPIPLTRKTVLQTLFVYPIDLFITFPRIAYEAWRLHYPKKMDVYPKPPPRVEDLGTVGQKPMSGAEIYAKDLVERFLEQRLQTMDVRVTIKHLREEEPQIFGKNSASQALDISTTSPLLYTDILWTPSADDALWLGMVSEKRWTVSDMTLFKQVFKADENVALENLQQPAEIRLGFMQWWASFARDEITRFKGVSEKKLPRNGLELPFPMREKSNHPLDAYVGSLNDVHAMRRHCKDLKSGCDAERTEQWVFTRMYARFVADKDPFRVYQRVWQAVLKQCT